MAECRAVRAVNDYPAHYFVQCMPMRALGRSGSTLYWVCQSDAIRGQCGGKEKKQKAYLVVESRSEVDENVKFVLPPLLRVMLSFTPCGLPSRSLFAASHSEAQTSIRIGRSSLLALCMYWPRMAERAALLAISLAAAHRPCNTVIQ